MPVKDVMNQGRFTRSGNAGNAAKNSKRNIDVNILEVVFTRTADLDGRIRFAALLRYRDRFVTGEIIPSEGLGSTCTPKHVRQRPAEDQFPAALATPRTDIDQVIRRANNLFFM